MNEFEWISEFTNQLIQTITLHQRKKNWNFFVFVINDNQAFVSEIYALIGPLKEKLDFFSPLEF